MKYVLYSSNQEVSLNELVDYKTFFDSIRNGKLALEQTQNKQKEYDEYLKTRKWNKSH